mmetsp:Transcript_11280/g.22673  ORF Transcript_11280/g.22673 Transcript_11280/m.22673 type:complete len:405 (+) Transcript_11280:229-1443(+)
MVVELTEKLTWYFYCQYFQADSEEMQSMLLDRAQELLRRIVKQIRPMMIGIAPTLSKCEHDKGLQAADTFYQYYPSVAADAIYNTWRELFCASLDLLDPSLCTQLNSDIFKLVNGTMPSEELNKAMRNRLFPHVQSNKRTDDSDDELPFVPRSRKATAPSTPFEQRRKRMGASNGHLSTGPRGGKEKFDVAGLSPSVTGHIGNTGRKPQTNLNITKRGGTPNRSPLPDEFRTGDKGGIHDRLLALRKWFEGYQHEYADMKHKLDHVKPTQQLQGPRPTSADGKTSEPLTVSALKQKHLRRLRSLRDMLIPTPEECLEMLLEEVKERGLDWLPKECIIENENILLDHDDPDVDILDVLKRNTPAKSGSTDIFGGDDNLATNGATSPPSGPADDVPRMFDDGHEMA